MSRIYNKMGQSATLYRVTQAEFERLSKDPESFNIRITEDHATFEQNFDGLLFLLSKLCSESNQPLIQEIFYPNDSVGRTIDLVDFEVLDDLSFLETQSINYLSQEKVRSIGTILNAIDRRQLLELYDPKELNANGVYPCIWHSDESANKAFNMKHIEDGFDILVCLFVNAVKNESAILVFVG